MKVLGTYKLMDKIEELRRFKLMEMNADACLKHKRAEFFSRKANKLQEEIVEEIKYLMRCYRKQNNIMLMGDV